MTIIFKCVRDKGWNLSEDPSGLIPEGSKYRGLYVSAQTVFYLTLNKTYRAHGLALYNGGLIALVLDDTGRPNWYPVEAFEVVDGKLPTDWRFELPDEDGPTGIQALWGYPELIDNPDHLKALIERDTLALSTFFEAARRNRTDG